MSGTDRNRAIHGVVVPDQPKNERLFQTASHQESSILDCRQGLTSLRFKPRGALVFLIDYFKKHNISYRLYEHPAVFTVAESKKVTQHIPGLRTKSLFLRDEHANFYLVCMPGEERLNIKALRALLNVKELHFGSPEELKQELRVTPGSVSLFAMIHAHSTTLIIDQHVWDAPLIGAHPNINTSTLVITHAALERFCASLAHPPKILKVTSNA